MAAAGFPNGFKTKLYYGTAPRPYCRSPSAWPKRFSPIFKKAGIDVTLEPFEWGVYLTKIRNGEHTMGIIGWTGDNGDPDNFFYPLLDRDSTVKGQAQNISFWKDPKFHDLMMAGQRTIDESKRRAIYLQAGRLVHDQVPLVPFVHTTVPLAMSSKVDGVIARPDGIVSFELMSPKAAAK